MRMMSVCVEGARGNSFHSSCLLPSNSLCAGAQGGALVNLIHSYTDNGDPFVRKFTDQLLEEVHQCPDLHLIYLHFAQVSKPFFATLHKWLFSGELYDPFSEFFVAMDPTLAHMQSLHPSSLAGGIAPPSGDGGFGGFVDVDDISVEREGGLKLWEAKYQFQEDMLPMFVGEAFGNKVLPRADEENHRRSQFI